MQDSVGITKGIAAIAGSEPASQMKIHGAAKPNQALTVEFIERICTVDEYVAEPIRWEGRALDRLGGWERPEFTASGSY
jgi:hypothetical protein